MKIIPRRVAMLIHLIAPKYALQLPVHRVWLVPVENLRVAIKDFCQPSCAGPRRPEQQNHSVVLGVRQRQRPLAGVAAQPFPVIHRE